ncbi:MAG: M14 family zinc carboxypeptidase [Acidobacteriota bacterium]
MHISYGCSMAIAVALLAPAMPSSGQQSSVPTPESVLGSPVGADFFLASYDESIAYFQQLDAASDRLQLMEIGRTSSGHPWYVALISSAENLANLEHYRQIAQRLAHPRGLTDEEARRLAREGKAIVHIDGGLHATEVAHAQHTIQLAYDLITGDDDPEKAAMLENVILLLWPSINPDGQTMVAEWYRSNLGTPFELSGMPELYQKYIGHDNNRDGYMLNMIESRVVTRVDRYWEPQILYNHHQSSPFPTRIWIPPFAEPISTYVHPLMWRTVNLLGMSMAEALEERGQVGATHMGTGFDNWYPGFLDHSNNFHNVASFLTETAAAGWATPRFYTIRDFPQNRRDLRPQSLYSSPWRGGWWRLRDAVDYMLTASFSVLDFAAKYKFDLLYNRYQAGRDVIDQYGQDPPYAFFIPQAQRDPVAPVELLRRLAFNGIEVYQLAEQVTHDGISYPAGTWVIPMDQPFANFVRQLFAVQEYPDLREFPEGPPDQPYDVAGWTLPYQMDVHVVEAMSPLTDTVRSAMRPMEGTAAAWDAGEDAGAKFDSIPGVGFNSSPPAAGIIPPAGSAPGSGSALLVDAAQNNSFRAINAAWRAGGTVGFQPGTAGTGGEPGRSGRYVISGVDEAARQRWVEDFALQATRGSASGARFTSPRIGLYRPWGGNIDEGWTRWLLEQYGFDPITVRNGDVRAGELNSRFDVIVLVDFGPDTLIEGRPIGSVPARYAGGIGREGLRALDAFVRHGGTLVCINNSSTFAIDELHLPVENVVSEIDRKEFFVSGSILAVTVDPFHPVMSGMPAEAKLFVGRGPVFTTKEGFEGSVLAKYPKEGSPLLSGYLLGEGHLQGYAAALDVHHDDGHVILIGFRPQWRGQSFGSFRVLFNAVLFHGALAVAAEGSEDFWQAPPEKEQEAEKKAQEGRTGAS